MKTDKNIPKVGQVADYIKKNSPKNSKCVDVDFLQMKGFCLVAWVIEKSLSQNQGYQQAWVSLYQNGKFGESQNLIPCRYYEEGGKRYITSCAFGSFLGEKKPTLLEKTPENQVLVTLVCGGKPISQMLIRHEKSQKTL